MAENPSNEIVRRKSTEITLEGSDIVRRGLEDSLAMTRRQKIRIMHVDDILETRVNIRRLLSFEDDMEVVSSLGRSQEAIDQYSVIRPDIVISDINRPQMSGLVMTRILCDMDSSAKVIILSVVSEADYMRAAMYAGARDFIAKPPSGKDLINTIRGIHETPNSGAPFLRGPPGVDVVYYYLDRWRDRFTRLGRWKRGSLRLGIGWRNMSIRREEFLLKDVDPSDVALLDFSGGELSPHVLSALQTFPGIEAVNLESCRVSKELVTEMALLEKLRMIWLNRASVEKGAIGSLADNPMLEILVLDHVHSTYEELSALVESPNLKHLSLIGTELDEQEAAKLESLLNLETLRLSK